MKPCAFAYAAPTTLTEAVRLLADRADDARLLAGGQSLVPALNFRLAAPALLIDLNRIPELAGIVSQPDGTWRAGAMTRHRTFERSPELRTRAPLVHAVMPSIAHLQIRNRGTIGGSLAHADPAAEWPALCVACAATITVAGPTGHRTIAAEQFIHGVYATALAPDEIVAAIDFPAWPATRRWGFREVARRRGDFAIAGVVCTADVDAAGLCTAARIVLFGIDDRPLVAADAGAALIGRAPDPVRLREAARIARAGVTPRSDLHASADYRGEIVEALTRRALAQAFALPDRAAA